MKTLIIILLISISSFCQDLGTKLPRQQSNAVEILKRSIKKDCKTLKTKKDTLNLNIKINAYQKITNKKNNFCLTKIKKNET